MLTEKKILILKSGRDDFEKYYIEHMQNKFVVTAQIYNNYSGMKGTITWLWAEIFRLPLLSIWYGGWKNNLDKYHTIIVFDNNLNWSIISFIKKRNPNARIIAWYWNIVNKKNSMPYKYGLSCEQWSFNPSDCKKYGMNYNHQFYFNVQDKDTNTDTDIDFFFIGKDKNRINKIEKLEKQLTEAGYKTDFRVLRDNTSKRKQSALYINKPINYKDVLSLIRHSKCIVELNQELQNGMTVRTLESFFLNKKLLTDNQYVVNSYKSSNIMFLSSNIQKEELDRFMKTPFLSYSEICETYNFQHWIKGFE